MISDLVDEYIRDEFSSSDWNERHAGKLAASEVGHCPRKAMLRLKGIETTDDFPMKVKRLMWSGKRAEKKMEHALEKIGLPYQRELVVETDIYMGTIDFLLPTLILEHKETATSNFHYNRLPYDFHLVQVMVYKALLGDEDLDAVIYYQNRGDVAEFEVRENVGQILYEGHINGKYRFGEIGTTAENEMEELAYWYHEDRIAPRYDTPFEKNFACTKMYSVNAYPTCTFWSHCWGDSEYYGMEKIPIPEEFVDG